MRSFPHRQLGILPIATYLAPLIVCTDENIYCLERFLTFASFTIRSDTYAEKVIPSDFAASLPVAFTRGTRLTPTVFAFSLSGFFGFTGNKGYSPESFTSSQTFSLEK